MWKLDHKEGWVPKNWCFWTVVLEKVLESPLDSKEIQPVYPKGNQSWVFIGRIGAEAPILWPPDVKNRPLEKTLMLGKTEDKRRRWAAEDEMVGWHHWLNGHEFEQAPGDGEGQGGLVCCSPWGCKESDMTERLNWTEDVNCSSSTYWLCDIESVVLMCLNLIFLIYKIGTITTIMYYGCEDLMK